MHHGSELCQEFCKIILKISQLLIRGLIKGFMPDFLDNCTAFGSPMCGAIENLVFSIFAHKCFFGGGHY